MTGATDVEDLNDPTHYAVLGYKLRPRVIDISRDIAYVSMKDQIIRGRWAVDCLVAAGGLVPNPFPRVGWECDLLIVGAGAAGAAAAMRAAHLGIHTLIIDRAHEAFARQARSTRLISPTLYDWPAQHWNKAPWPNNEPVAHDPIGDPSMLAAKPALGVVATASAFARDWSTQFMKWAADPILQFEPHCGLAEALNSIRKPRVLNRDRLIVKLRCTPLHPIPNLRVRVRPRWVLFALGPGPEQTTVGKGATAFTGARFWVAEDGVADKIGAVDVDPLENDPLVNERGPVGSVLISGAGDGGVQDFLRTVLRPKYHNLELVIDQLRALDASAWTTLEQEVVAAEWHTERARQLGASEGAVHGALHLRFNQAVRDWVSSVGGVPVDTTVSRLLRSPIPMVTWAVGPKGSVYYDKSYALNRVLGILLAWRAAGNVNFVLDKLVSVSNTIAGSWLCVFGDASRWSRTTVDHVIIRHGLARPGRDPETWRNTRPDMRFEGLRKAFQRLAQPFKPVK